MLLGSIITFVTLLIIATVIFSLGLAASVLGFVGKVFFGIVGFGMRLTLKTILAAVAIVVLLLAIIF